MFRYKTTNTSDLLKLYTYCEKLLGPILEERSKDYGELLAARRLITHFEFRTSDTFKVLSFECSLACFRI